MRPAGIEPTKHLPEFYRLRVFPDSADRMFALHYFIRQEHGKDTYFNRGILTIHRCIVLKGVEPSSSDWKSNELTIIRQDHVIFLLYIVKDQYLDHMGIEPIIARSITFKLAVLRNTLMTHFWTVWESNPLRYTASD